MKNKNPKNPVLTGFDGRRQHLNSNNNGCMTITYGFTLAETMIVLVVLGVIATLTVPNLVNKQRETTQRTKLKKAMALYETAVNKMILENNRSFTGLNGAGCDKTIAHFKYIKRDSNNGCIFQTSDKIWWDLTDIQRPLISFNEITNANKEEIIKKANIPYDYSAFIMVGRFDKEGILRVDDLVYEKANPLDNSDDHVEKLYMYIKAIPAKEYDKCKIGTKKFIDDSNSNSKYTEVTYDNKGNPILEITYDNNGNVSSRDTYENTYKDGVLISTKKYYSNGNYSARFDYEYNDKGLASIKTDYTTADGNVINMRYYYEYDDKGNMLSERGYRYYWDNAAKEYKELGYYESENLYTYNDKDKILTKEEHRFSGGEMYYNMQTSYDYDDDDETLLSEARENQNARRNKITTRYTYDAKGNLVSANKYNKSGNLTATYQYDECGRIKESCTVSTGVCKSSNDF